MVENHSFFFFAANYVLRYRVNWFTSVPIAYLSKQQIVIKHVRREDATCDFRYFFFLYEILWVLASKTRNIF